MYIEYFRGVRRKELRVFFSGFWRFSGVVEWGLGFVGSFSFVLNVSRLRIFIFVFLVSFFFCIVSYFSRFDSRSRFEVYFSSGQLIFAFFQERIVWGDKVTRREYLGVQFLVGNALELEDTFVFCLCFSEMSAIFIVFEDRSSVLLLNVYFVFCVD